jgi:ribosomal-protein-alanine N-acetyltransferase
MDSIPLLNTKRLLLRAFDVSDAPAVYEIMKNPAIADTTLKIPYPYPAGAAEQWISSHHNGVAAGSDYHWAIERLKDGVVVGSIGLHVESAHKRGSLGYWIGMPFWNHGLATEAVGSVVEFGFTTLELNRIEAMCFPRNPASARVLEKCEFKFEGTLMEYLLKNDQFEDASMYSLVRRNWLRYR